MFRSLSSVPKGSSISLAISSRPIYLGEGGGRRTGRRAGGGVCECVCVCVCVDGDDEGLEKVEERRRKKREERHRSSYT